MIPILKERIYENSAISFKTVGFLADAHNCQVTEERNGIFEMSFSYPVESLMFQYLREDLLVLAKPNDTDDNQLFRIYEIAKPINGVVTVKCEHVSYELRNYPVKNVELHLMAPHAMIQGLIDYAKSTVSGQNSDINLYTACSSNRSVTSSLDLPLATVRSALGGMDGSVLDIFGGEYKFDNFRIYLPEARGSDKGVIVAYRKNLIDVKLTTSMESSYTGLFPYVLKDDAYTFLDLTQYPTGSISVTNNSGIAERILMRDFSSEFESDEEVTSAALLTKALSFLSNNDINALTASMSVSFVNLWQSEEYKDYAPLEKVGLCDIVTVFYEKLGINLKLKVIKTIYDPISERYIKIELGSPKADFAATIAQQQNQVNEAVQKARSGYSQITAEYRQAVADASAKITGNSGGYVRFTLNANGQPEEITVMDTNNYSTAIKCWRWNKNGLGYSPTGYSGTYETAITADGEIVADFITAGTLTADIIRAGVLSSAQGNSYFNLDSGLIHTANAEIVGGSISIGGGPYKTVIKDGSICQHLQSVDTPLGGMVPVGSGNDYYECIYASKLSTSKGVSIAYQNNDDTFTTVAEFGKENTRIRGISSKFLELGEHMVWNGSNIDEIISSLSSSVSTNTSDIVDLENALDNLENVTGTSKVGDETHYTTLDRHNTHLAAYYSLFRNSNGGIRVGYGSSKTWLHFGYLNTDGNGLSSTYGNITCKNDGVFAFNKGHDDGTKSAVYASSFNSSSTENLKTNISSTETDALLLLESSVIYNFDYLDGTEEVTETTSPVGIDDNGSGEGEGEGEDGENGTGEEEEETLGSNLGFVIGRETPDEVISEDGTAVNLYSFTSLTWLACQQLLDRIKALEARVDELENPTS